MIHIKVEAEDMVVEAVEEAYMVVEEGAIIKSVSATHN
jgi:hypothetical protein